jgi:hypothetical protein
MECDGHLGTGPTKPTKPTKAPKIWSVTKSLYTNELRQRPTNRPKSAETSPNSAQYAQFLQPLVGWSVQRAKPLSSNELVNRPKTSGLVGLVGSWSVRPLFSCHYILVGLQRVTHRAAAKVGEREHLCPGAFSGAFGLFAAPFFRHYILVGLQRVCSDWSDNGISPCPSGPFRVSRGAPSGHCETWAPPGGTVPSRSRMPR